MAAGSWSLGANASGTTVRVRHDAPEDDPPTEHDQRFWIGEMRLNAAYGLSDRFGMDVQVPLRVTNTTVRFERLDGGSLPSNYESIHHRNEMLQGIGDPRIAGRSGWTVLGTDVSTGLGLSIPLGRTEPDPFHLGDEGKRHQHIQFGTGTFDPFVELDVRRKLGAVTWALRAGALVPFQENEHGFQAGPRLNGSVEASLPAWMALEPALRVDVSREGAETWDGEVPSEGNRGRSDALVGASVRYPMGGYRVSLDVSVPVWQRVEGSQLEYPAVIGLGISRAFGTGR